MSGDPAAFAGGSRHVIETGVLYETTIAQVVVKLTDDRSFEFDEVLSNGRASYVIFENLVRELTGLVKATGSDHKDDLGRKYEQKAYPDIDLWPRDKDLFRCSASSTFGANNNGPRIKRLLDDGDYEGALEICRETGYDKNDFYIFTNTSKFVPSVPFRFVCMTAQDVLANVDKDDPRLISRSMVLQSASRVQQI